MKDKLPSWHRRNWG